MEYFVKSGRPEKQHVACVIVGIYERRKASESAELIDQASEGQIAAVMRHGDMDGKLGQTLVLHNIKGASADRVLLVGLGKERGFDERAYRRANAVAAKALRNTGAVDAISYLTHLDVKGRDVQWNVQQAALTFTDSAYRFEEMLGERAREELTAPKLERVTFDVPHRGDLKPAEAGLAQGLAIAKGVTLTKNLSNLPGNICTPTYLAEQAQQLAGQYPIKTKILEQADMEQLGMGSLLSVAKGSRQPPKFIVMEYLHGAADEKPIALVGKGLTFDAGGISIKPADKMDEMKFDMCGGASVFGTLVAIAELKLPINVVGVVPATENLINGQASKPGDIVKSMAGITIEVLNTDAEGRLILCDALTYVEKFYEPRLCVDMATLTGAVIVALGAFPTGLLGNTPSLNRALLAAGEEIGDRAWELPLWAEYDDNLKSEFADVANIATRGGREAGAIIGATFLHRFTRKMKWAHLDIAGTAWVGKAATGRPVPLLTQWLLNESSKAHED